MHYEEIEKRIGYTFNNKELLKTALTHTSYANTHGIESNEKLEYLGDSILEFITSKYLYNEYKNLTEGEMTKVRATVVCEQSLYKVANHLGFCEFIITGKGEKTIKGVKNKAILADSVEAVIAAIYLDSGIENVEKFIISNLKTSIEEESKHVGIKDYKTVLQEKLQENGNVKIEYKIIAEEGPDHDKNFVAQVLCDDKVLAHGRGKSKKKAEMEAAKYALKTIKRGESNEDSK